MNIPGNNQGPNPKKVINLIVLGVAVLILFVVLTNTTFLTIDAGHRGVLFERFGGGLKMDKIYKQGFHVVAPWNTMFIYDVRVNENYEKMSVLSRNGLTIEIDLSYRYRPYADSLPDLHNQIGRAYHERIILPEIRSATREVIGQYLPEELYSTKREIIQKEIYEKAGSSIERRFIQVDAILIREVNLPETLQDAIERKLGQEQAALEYEFRLERERKEAERKVIAAKADAQANRILSASITPNILKDKGIDATLKLAQSSNSKVVVVGGGGDGLPLILGNN
ncbi:MAG: prohibitin family protein [Bacteroidetes bacterium]|jgi:regulator of protease activity HflC (stomatin/prohibitin superfamily)|nr:prohibitin family protein [Bacteroidota bacterium]